MAVEVIIQNRLPVIVNMDRKTVIAELPTADVMQVEVQRPRVYVNTTPPVEVVLQLDQQGPPGIKGTVGDQGVRGPAGPDTIEYVDNLPDFSLIFENRLV